MTLEQEKVSNLSAIELLIHARHLYLESAKDFLKSPNKGLREVGLQCAETVEALQAAIDVELMLP